MRVGGPGQGKGQAEALAAARAARIQHLAAADGRRCGRGSRAAACERACWVGRSVSRSLSKVDAALNARARLSSRCNQAASRGKICGALAPPGGLCAGRGEVNRGSSPSPRVADGGFRSRRRGAGPWRRRWRLASFQNSLQVSLEIAATAAEPPVRRPAQVTRRPRGSEADPRGPAAFLNACAPPRAARRAPRLARLPTENAAIKPDSFSPSAERAPARGGNPVLGHGGVLLRHLVHMADRGVDLL